MKSKHIVQWMAAVAAGLVVTATAWAAPNTSYDRLVVFGDSLSDPGNAFVLLGKSSAPPFDLIPDAPYARGGMHFSNGATWVEQLARPLGLNASVGPALRVPGVFSNYAVGATRARATGEVSLADQVQLFLNNATDGVSPAALYVVFVGGNDVRDAIAAFETDPSGLTSAGIIADAVTAVTDNIAALAASGAQTFLVPNAPDLGLVPAVRAQGPLVQFISTQMSVAYNNALATALAGLQAALQVTIIPMDVFAAFHAVVLNPESAGLTNVEESCITPDTQAGAFCGNANRYLFWDGIHPTRAGHGVLAGAALTALGQ